MKLKVRAFNESGILEFRKYLEELRLDRTKPIPYELLENPELTSDIRGKAIVENVEIHTRLDAAKYLSEVLKNIDHNEYENNKMWTWLSLFFFDQLCPADKNGVRKPGDAYRYILSDNWRTYYRHILQLPFKIFKNHNGNGKVLLCNEINKIGEINESIASRQEFLSSASIIEVLDKLYFDAAKKTFKRGCTTTNSKGTIRRFVSIIKQFELTYDIFSMTSVQIMELLPKNEFNKWVAK